MFLRIKIVDGERRDISSMDQRLKCGIHSLQRHHDVRGSHKRYDYIQRSCVS